jgi:sulfane dehydrogenase subunit SoxC
MGFQRGCWFLGSTGPTASSGSRASPSPRDAAGPFTIRWYNDPVLDRLGDETGETTPVGSIAPESVIVSPAPQDSIRLSREHEIWGWAWADGGVASVGVRISDETAWQSADLEPPRGREWQRFSLAWTPRHPGPTLIASRAQALTGERQPIAGRRNAIHSVAVSILCP